MLVVMRRHATEAEIKQVIETIESLGLTPHPIPGAQRTAVCITGNEGEVDAALLESVPGVAEVIKVSKPYKLVTCEVKEEETVIPVGDALIGGPSVVIMAGPCAVESEAQTMQVAQQLAGSEVKIFRGGAFKPRTSPYSFQGLGKTGLEILAKVRREFGMRIVTEAVDSETVDLVAEYADIVQIGARNMQNFSLLKRAGKCARPVLLKRGLSATLDEFLMAAEYILSEGNYDVILCERGVRTFTDHTRNTLDLSVVPAVKRLSHLPIIVDPSHGTGKRHKVIPLARAAVAVGADGIMVEVHSNPEKAMSDGPQSLYPEQFKEMLAALRLIAAAVGRTLS